MVAENDAVLLATGATKSFDPTGRCPGRDLKGIHLAMDFLTRNTKSLLDTQLNNGHYISAKGLDVIVIGGGDTGADCIGTSLRHGCKSIVNFELLDQPPEGRAANNPWPEWPRIYRVDYSHAETKAKFGHDPREYSILTKEFVGDDKGHVTGVKTALVDWSKPGEKAPFTEVPGQRKDLAGRFGVAGHRLPWPRNAVSARCSASKRSGRAGNWETFKADHGPFATNVPNSVCRGRLPPRSIARRVGDQRRPRRRPRRSTHFLMGSSTLPAPGITQGMLASV